jgi:flagellar motor switch protein FliM
MSFEIKIGETRGVLNVCFPATSIEAVSGSFTRSWQRTQRDMTPNEQAVLDENVGRVNVTLSAGIQAAIGGADFLRLQVGDIVGLDHPAGEPIGGRSVDAVIELACYPELLALHRVQLLEGADDPLFDEPCRHALRPSPRA